MKTFLFVTIILLVTSTSFGQTWFQTSMEHKFNAIAGTSVSTEVGYNIVNYSLVSIAPSIDYTFYSNGDKTQTLLLECVTVTYFPVGLRAVTPYISITPAHLDGFLSDNVGDNTKHHESFGGSVQVGVGFELNKNAQFFSQYRYFKYTTLLEGQLIQFGIMYTFGG